MSRTARIALLALAMLTLGPHPAHADLTAFIGAAFSGKPQDTVGGESRTSLTRGLSFGVGLLIVGFEFEWAHTSGEDVGDGSCTVIVSAQRAPVADDGMGNVLLQTPRGLGPVQFYGPIGGGRLPGALRAVDESTTRLRHQLRRRREDRSCSDRCASGSTTGSSSCRETR